MISLRPKTLDETSLSAVLLAQDKLEPYAYMFFGNVVDANGVKDGSLCYAALDDFGHLTGSGIIHGSDRAKVELFYKERYARSEVHQVSLDAVPGKYRGIAIVHMQRDIEHLFKVANQQLAELQPEPTEEQTLAAYRKQLSQPNFRCDDVEKFAMMVSVLQKPMDAFKFDPLRLAYVVSRVKALASVADEIDLEKKALIYGKESYGVSAYELEQANFLSDIDVGPLNAPEQKQLRNLHHHLLGVIGEGGEVANFFANIENPGAMAEMAEALASGNFKPFTNLVEELGDLMFYVIGALMALGVPLGSAMHGNYLKLWKGRYPNGYSDEAAINRDTQNEMKELGAELHKGDK